MHNVEQQTSTTQMFEDYKADNMWKIYLCIAQIFMFKLFKIWIFILKVYLFSVLQVQKIGTIHCSTWESAIQGQLLDKSKFPQQSFTVCVCEQSTYIQVHYHTPPVVFVTFWTGSSLIMDGKRWTPSLAPSFSRFDSFGHFLLGVCKIHCLSWRSTKRE